ncbi:hypothetical protein M422DRAFT_34828 [Sphaerobolus stellatus SS14]|uniref:Uncharacterized protein n=1 Tax=Sphaerobolus stellatus (strain SS14) TaxID=990650 RepID=A0A0C9VBX6_SPHS4|nr:hypothetical protein M422DRAFT_34828 [Sphaerobolus stellatus SS14]
MSFQLAAKTFAGCSIEFPWSYPLYTYLLQRDDLAPMPPMEILRNMVENGRFTEEIRENTCSTDPRLRTDNTVGALGLSGIGSGIQMVCQFQLLQWLQIQWWMKEVRNHREYSYVTSKEELTTMTPERINRRELTVREALERAPVGSGPMVLGRIRPTPVPTIETKWQGYSSGRTTLSLESYAALYDEAGKTRTGRPYGASCERDGPSRSS